MFAQRFSIPAYCQVLNRHEKEISKMFAQRFWMVVLVAVTTVFLASAAHASALAPVALTGYNWDEMYGSAGGTGGGYAQAVSSVDPSAFFATGAVDKNGVTQSNGLPVGNFASLTDSSHTYCLAAAGGATESDNVLGLGVGINGNLYLATPGKYSQIGVLATSTNVATPGDGGGLGLVLNYSDSTSTTTTYNAYDWNYSGGGAAPASGAVNYNRAGGASVPGAVGGFTVDTAHPNWFWLYETVVGVDPTKTLSYITFDGFPSEDPAAHTEIFAVSGLAVPEPSTSTLVGIALISLLAYAWRRQK